MASSISAIHSGCKCLQFEPGSTKVVSCPIEAKCSCSNGVIARMMLAVLVGLCWSTDHMASSCSLTSSAPLLTSLSCDFLKVTSLTFSPSMGEKSSTFAYSFDAR